MHQPRKWWIGLPILVALTYFAAANLTPRIEADLQSRMAARLAQGGMGKPQIVVAGRDATVLGAGSAGRTTVFEALRSEPGLRRLNGAAEMAAIANIRDPQSAREPARVKPYVFSAVIGGGMITLSGQLPTEELRKRVVAWAAAFGAGAAVSDVTLVDAAAPKGDYAAAVGFALESLGRLSQGRVALADNKISIEGQGRENVRAETVEAEAKAHLPQGFELAKAEIASGPVSPYVFTVSREGAEATLTGYAPDEGTRKRIVDAARRRFFDATLNDRLAVAGGAPENFADAVEASLTSLARLAEGKFAMTGANVSLSGAARYESARADIETAFAAALPRNFKADARLLARTVGSPLDAASCRAALAVLTQKPIAFESDDSRVAADSAPLLDALTATILRCQGVAIEVAAHTDNFGIEELNRDRSKRRARAVIDRLVKAGADPFRVWAMGYGGERPIAPNDSEENRARNRRIEFVVK